MRYSVIKKVILIILHITGIHCSAYKHVIERIRYLENRLNSESMFRDQDYADVIERLDGIDKRLNESLKQSVGFVNNPVQETADGDVAIADHLREDFTRIRRAFGEEKSESSRIRREIPKIENKLISVEQDVERYCLKNLNKTEQLVTLVSEADELMKNEIFLQINEIKREQKDLLSEINKKTEAKFDFLSSQIEQMKVNTTKHNENVELLISKIYDRVRITSCSDMKYDATFHTGIYKVRNVVKEVFCDQSKDGGGWTVFQRRQNGEVDFYRNFSEYKDGFGDLNGEFWLGNKYLSDLTSSGDNELRIDMEDFEGNRVFAKYSKFKVFPEEDNYKLEVSGYSGNAGDSLVYHNGMSFSTLDNDNDLSSGNCAIEYHGAWWYNVCHYSNLNGKYFNEINKYDDKGINWREWSKWKYGYCLKFVEMKFRSKSLNH